VTAGAAGQTDAERTSQLEQVVRPLRAWVAALEAASSTQTTKTADGDRVRWRSEPPVTGRLPAVRQKQLDRRPGSAELMLELTAPFPERVRGLNDEVRLPLTLVSTHADVSETSHPVQMMRRSPRDPGSFPYDGAACDPSNIARIDDILIRSERAALNRP
jgi:hypothetical protein